MAVGALVRWAKSPKTEPRKSSRPCVQTALVYVNATPARHTLRACESAGRARREIGAKCERARRCERGVYMRRESSVFVSDAPDSQWITAVGMRSPRGDHAGEDSSIEKRWVSFSTCTHLGLKQGKIGNLHLLCSAMYMQQRIDRCVRAFVGCVFLNGERQESRTQIGIYTRLGVHSRSSSSSSAV